MNQRCLLNLINNVTNGTCAESHEAALFTYLDYHHRQHNVHSVKNAALCTKLDNQRHKPNMPQSLEAALCT
jgi:hypothetical protein